MLIEVTHACLSSCLMERREGVKEELERLACMSLKERREGVKEELEKLAFMISEVVCEDLNCTISWIGPDSYQYQFSRSPLLARGAESVIKY